MPVGGLFALDFCELGGGEGTNLGVVAVMPGIDEPPLRRNRIAETPLRETRVVFGQAAHFREVVCDVFEGLPGRVVVAQLVLAYGDIVAHGGTTQAQLPRVHERLQSCFKFAGGKCNMPGLPVGVRVGHGLGCLRKQRQHGREHEQSAEDHADTFGPKTLGISITKAPAR